MDQKKTKKQVREPQKNKKEDQAKVIKDKTAKRGATQKAAKDKAVRLAKAQAEETEVEAEEEDKREDKANEKEEAAKRKEEAAKKKEEAAKKKEEAAKKKEEAAKEEAAKEKAAKKRENQRKDKEVEEADGGEETEVDSQPIKRKLGSVTVSDQPLKKKKTSAKTTVSITSHFLISHSVPQILVFLVSFFISYYLIVFR